MKQEMINEVERILGNETSWDDIKIRDSYSGKSMYGDSTIAIVTSLPPEKFYKAIYRGFAELQLELDEDDDTDLNDESDEEIERIARNHPEFKRPSWDRMGLSYIYY